MGATSRIDIVIDNQKARVIFEHECTFDKPLGAKGARRTEWVIELAENEGTKDATKAVGSSIGKPWKHRPSNPWEKFSKTRHKRLSIQLHDLILTLMGYNLH